MVQNINPADMKGHFQFAVTVLWRLKFKNKEKKTADRVVPSSPSSSPEESVSSASLPNLTANEKEEKIKSQACITWDGRAKKRNWKTGTERKRGCNLICAFFLSSLTYHSRRDISGTVSFWIFRLCTLLSLSPRSLANPNFLNLVVSTVEGKQNKLRR